MTLGTRSHSAFTRNFGGLNSDCSGYDDARFVVLAIPYEYPDTTVKGTSGGPVWIVDASLSMELFDEELHQCTSEMGIYTAAPFTSSRLQDDFVESIRAEVRKHIEAGKFVVSLGGEHTVTYPLAMEYRAAWPDLTVLQIDAHADLHDEEQGDRLTNITVMRRVSEAMPVVQLGIRSCSAAEWPLLNKGNVTTITARDMILGDTWKQTLMDSLGENVYINIDVDGFDPSVIPDPGNPQPGGLQWYPTLDLLREVFQSRNVVGMDIVELCPTSGTITGALACAKLAYRCMGYASLKS